MSEQVTGKSAAELIEQGGMPNMLAGRKLRLTLPAMEHCSCEEVGSPRNHSRLGAGIYCDECWHELLDQYGLIDEASLARSKADAPPQMEDLYGIDITGGMDSVEYVRNMRD